ncbi:SDR family NAD(P)-dependent oxidoreductase [Burkholderia sp. Leaf177]|uniref:SDR family NAD(P)-dependent oxidoreductase n=1 Tax=Burkholderia sp. Leaf177 TaxID=1736287 RepID=UPI000AE65E0C
MRAVMRELGSPGSAAYSASKAGITGMAKVFASELVERGIRVNTVIPGATLSASPQSMPDRDASGTGPHQTCRYRHTSRSHCLPRGLRANPRV